MNHFRSTERHLTLLKLPGSLMKLKGSRAKSTGTGYRFNGPGAKPNGSRPFDFSKLAGQRQYTNHVSSRFVNNRFGQKTIKLKEVMQTRFLTTSNFNNIPLLNPNKLDPVSSNSELVVKPITPLTMPRFPKSGASDKPIPSVTKILQATMPASSQFMLERWKEGMIKKLGMEGFNKYQQETFERGRILHAVLANYLLGCGEPGKELTKEIVANLWKSIQNVVKDKISNVRLVEHIVTHSDLKYRGIIDCVAFYQDELVVIDFKTAEKPKKSVGSLFDNPLQVTAYCGAINNDKTIPEHVIDRNICAGLVVVAYVDGSEASVYYLGREQVMNQYWGQWTKRLDQFSRLEEMRQEQDKTN